MSNSLPRPYTQDRNRLLHVVIMLAGTLLGAATFAQSPAPASASNAGGVTPPVTEPVPAGTIDLVGSNVRIIKPGLPPRRAVVGDIVSEGDSLVTGKDSEAHMTMQDAGFIALRPNTRFRIVGYKAEGGSDDKGVFALLAGGMRSVTGWIGKFNQDAYKVRTPTATIGVRGTDHETRYIPAGSSEGEPGTYDKVFAGGTTIQAEGGRADVAPNQAGFVSPRGRDRPRVLDRVPGFYRPGPNEALIEKKHAEVQQMIAQRRDERRKVIAEKRAALDAARSNLKSQQDANKAAAEQRRAAAQQQQTDAKARREALREQGKDLQEKQKSLQEKRKALQEGGAAAKPGDLRAQRRELREGANAAREERKELLGTRKALPEQNKAAIEERKKAAAERQQALKDQRKDVQEKGANLKQEREATKEELKALREQERKRYRDERKADRQQVAPPSAQ